MFLPGAKKNPQQQQHLFSPRWGLRVRDLQTLLSNQSEGTVDSVGVDFMASKSALCPFWRNTLSYSGRLCLRQDALCVLFKDKLQKK